jgi:hypothetical protein
LTLTSIAARRPADARERVRIRVPDQLVDDDLGVMARLRRDAVRREEGDEVDVEALEARERRPGPSARARGASGTGALRASQEQARGSAVGKRPGSAPRSRHWSRTSRTGPAGATRTTRNPFDCAVFAAAIRIRSPIDVEDRHLRQVEDRVDAARREEGVEAALALLDAGRVHPAGDFEVDQSGEVSRAVTSSRSSHPRDRTGVRAAGGPRQDQASVKNGRPPQGGVRDQQRDVVLEAAAPHRRAQRRLDPLRLVMRVSSLLPDRPLEPTAARAARRRPPPSSTTPSLKR